MPDQASASDSHADAPREMAVLATARVRDAYLRKPIEVAGSLNLREAAAVMKQHDQSHVLVRDAQRLGVLTTSDLRDALLDARAPQDIRLREIARFELLTIEADDELFEALWLMLRHRVHRLVVLEQGQVIGVLGQLDVVSFVANHSHLIALQIDDAQSIATLAAAARRMEQTVVSLHDGGLRVDRIARLIGELNHRLFRRAWELLAPPEVVANTCLIVMGSEGRGEQIFKTDQDNALIVRDGFEHPGLEPAAQAFNRALSEFGYPPCPGQIMVTNPQWRQSVAGFQQAIESWLYDAKPEGPMHLAIFLDAAPVAGDAALLQALREHLDRILVGRDQYLARFAAAADRFAERGNWLTRMMGVGQSEPLDLKKLGVFPIVQGVRALALQHGVRALSTSERLTALRAKSALSAELTRDLLEALQHLIRLRVEQQLRARAAGKAPDNLVRPADLSSLERERLASALNVVRGFRQWLRHHFRFDVVR